MWGALNESIILTPKEIRLALHKLASSADGGRPDYVAHGDFTNMIYFCPDIRYDYLKKGTKDEYIERTDEELDQLLKEYLISLSVAANTWLDMKVISDYWLVVTPEICDKLNKDVTPPLKQENFIVTPYYSDDIELVRQLIRGADYSHIGYGTSILREDKRKRRASDAVIGFYLACEINLDSKYFEVLKTLDTESKEYQKAYQDNLLAHCLRMGTCVTKYMDMPMRSFIQYQKNKYGIQFVEQYFDSRVSKKTSNFPLGEGYIRNMLNDVNKDKNYKYVAFEDLFESTGVDFCNYALSKEDLRKFSKTFEENSWCPRPEFDNEDEQAKRILAKDFLF